MEKVLKAQWNPKKESEEKVFENVTFETAVRGLDVLYRSGGGAYELDVCVDGRTVAVAALTGTARLSRSGNGACGNSAHRAGHLYRFVPNGRKSVCRGIYLYGKQLHGKCRRL